MKSPIRLVQRVRCAINKPSYAATFLLLSATLTAFLGTASAQPLDVTFRYHPQPGYLISKAYLLGDEPGWSPDANREMTLDNNIGAWTKTLTLSVGTTTEYKFFVEFPGSGSLWLPDPLNPLTNPDDNNNSVLNVTDPMLFEPFLATDEDGAYTEYAIGVFGTSPIAEMTLTLNGQTFDVLSFYDTDLGVLRYPFDDSISGDLALAFKARDEAGREVSTSFGVTQTVAVDEPRPPGIEDGINYHDDPSRVTLSLFAPYKNSVAVIGDFNDWQVDSTFAMKRDSVNADSMYFWLELEGLLSGVEYAFQYLIDGTIRVGDPYSEKILDPSYDAELTSVYPGLKPYPTGKTTEIVSVIRTGVGAFEWTATDFVRPPQHELIIYELLVRDFVAGGNYATLIDSLDYLQRLGVNAIELMPVAEFDRNENWGYEPAFHLAPDKAYGPSDDLKRFVDACHARGIAVILDVVYNHVTGWAPFLRMYNQSPTGAAGVPAVSENPWVNPIARHPFNVFNDVNHESRATQYWLDRANAFWLTEYNVDGFRFDLTKGFTQVDYGDDVGAWGGYDDSRVALLERMVDRIWDLDPKAYVIFEHLGANQEEREYAEYRVDEGMPGILLWGNENSEYSEATMGYNDGGKSNFSGVYFGSRRWSVPNLVGYMESHDEQWLMFKNRNFAACENAPLGGSTCDTDPGAYNIRSLPIALDRMKMAGAFFFTIPGPKMMLQFGELGYGWGPDECLQPDNRILGDCPPGNPIRTGPKPIRWDYFEDPLRRKLYESWSALIGLRRSHPVFSSPDTEVSLDTNGALKQILLTNTDMNVSIVGNFGVTANTRIAEFQHTGVWYDFFSGDSLVVADAAVEIPLAPGQFHIYTDHRVSAPEADLITVDSEASVTPTRVPLKLSVYPNPFDRRATLSFRLAEATDVEITLYDMLGRKVGLVDRGYRAAGLQRVRLSNIVMSPGVYLLNTRAGRENASRLIHIAGQ